MAALERWTVFRLDRASAALREHGERALERQALSLVRFAVLAVLEEHGPLSPSTLAGRVGVDRTTMSDILGELRHRKLVRRGPHSIDGRRHAITLTQGGADVLGEAASALRRVEAAFLETLDDYEREDLRETLRRLEPPAYVVGDLHLLAPRRRPSG